MGTVQKEWELNDLQRDIWKKKYAYNGESFDQWIDRVSGGDNEMANMIRSKKAIFAGRILAHRGLDKYGLKVTLSNCYVMTPPEDNIGHIVDACKELAMTYAAGGGCGIDIGKLRPKGTPVNNAARASSGATSFMPLYDMITGIIGQNGRNGALMISIPDSHPDIEDFINIKTKDGAIERANISIRFSDTFMQSVKEDKMWRLHWEGENGKVVEKYVSAKRLFRLNVQNNWDWAEAGFLFWDRISGYHLMSTNIYHEFAGVNPCAEEPLMAGGSCLLSSINLAEFVIYPFTSEAYFDHEHFFNSMMVMVKNMNVMLDEGMQLHPLEIQRENARLWRQIGVGPMGIADMLIKMGIRYGSYEAIELSKEIGRIMANAALTASALLAKEDGPFPMYDEETLFKSDYFNFVASVHTRGLVKKYGLRNSQLLTIAPTGSVSTMLGISGGIEPIFALSYKRKTESMHQQVVYYDVNTPIIEELKQHIGDVELPEYVVTAHTISWLDRIKMQGVWQKYIDASISSTVNLPVETTIEECEDLFMSAWEYGLKGITIFRDGCKRTGILTIDNKPEEKQEYIVCLECGEKIEVMTNGCTICMNCGHSPCGN